MFVLPRTDMVLSSLLGVAVQLVFVLGREDTLSFIFAILLGAVLAATRGRGFDSNRGRLLMLLGAMIVTELVVFVVVRVSPFAFPNFR
jgi:hypothetical protein